MTQNQPAGSHRKPRTLILCFDGTTDQYDDTNTNVVKLYSLFKKDSAHEQICYYQAGVGTYNPPGLVSPISTWLAQTLDKGVAWFLYQHVMDGYKFLMQNYNVGDKVCLFGFSRGAYTARALAGMLHKVGLLSKDNIEQIPFAYKLYTSTKDSDTEIANGFNVTFCRQVPIEFVGVWDTVASVGFLLSRSLPFVTVNTTIKRFRHALALDEHRSKFCPKLYHRSKPNKPRQANPESPTDEKFPNEPDVKEVWFVGSHADVGGGSVLDKQEHSLSNISLRWMIQELIQADCGVLFDPRAFKRWNLPVDIVRPPPSPSQSSFQGSSGSGESSLGLSVQQSLASLRSYDSSLLDARDVEQRINDQLHDARVWWLLEIIPTRYPMLTKKGKWVKKISSHRGHGRCVPPGPLFHESVRTHIEKSGYRPKARYEPGTEIYVT
ncbi:Uncharacterized alpha/beta hydrolase domain (DUF2235) domain containing protein [Russula decolorans]